MGLTVLSVAYPFATVDADPVGGAEQVLSQIDRALVEAGHRSIVAARAGPSPAAALVPLPTIEGELSEAARAEVRTAVRARIAETLARERVDVVHLHGIDFADYLPPVGPPCLTTLHMPLDWYPEAALRPARPGTWLLPVSFGQAATAPDGVRLLAPIANGVDIEAFTDDERRRGYALCLGRMCEEKGFHLALEAARAAGVPLLIAGKVYPYAEHEAYFAREIRPRLGARARYLGPVGGAAKRRLIAGARCVLIPSLAPETSSLVAREAAAAGTPVVAFRAGALPEAVEHGRTGFVVDDAAGMAAAMARVDEIDPAICRAVARERFDVRRTTAAYLDLYARLARG